MKQVLDIFYNEVIIEASSGLVECYFSYDTLFETIIEDHKVTTYNGNDKNILVPTLIIEVKKEFDNLLLKYVLLATDFYKDSKIEELDEHDYIKSILTLLWSNATSEDFLNPCNYLRKQIAFIKEERIIALNEVQTSLGNLSIKKEKDGIYNETPYYLNIKIDNDQLPVVRYGIYNDTAYIYSIQNISKEERNKKLNRAFYKVNEGIDLDREEKDNIAHPENLRGVTPATLISLNIALAYFKKHGIDHIIVPVMLPVRWNAKEFLLQRKVKYLKQKGESSDTISKYLTEAKNKNEDIQRNLSDKFIRTFRRLEYHFDNINIIAYPFIDDIDMHVQIDDEIKGNNPLLEELFISVCNRGIER